MLWFNFTDFITSTQNTPNTETHQQMCVFVFGILHMPSHTSNTDANHEMTPTGESFRGRCLSYALPHAHHEMTPTLVSFRGRHLPYHLPLTPSTKRHPCWCLLVFGMSFLCFTTRPPRNHTNKGVISCWASHRTRKYTLVGVVSCSVCLQHMPNKKQH